jgi:tetratricopeptide (TPR) repeat protein
MISAGLSVRLSFCMVRSLLPTFSIVLLVGSLLAASPVLPAHAASPFVETDTLNVKRAQAQRLFVRGLTQAYLNNADRAIALYERALGLTPNEAPILSAMAEAQADQDASSAAIFYAEQAQRLAPDNVHYYRQLADLHESVGDTDAAIATYRRLVDRFPNRVDAKLDLARMLADAHESQEALTLYESVERQMEGATAQMYMSMLQLYRRLNDSENVGRVLRALVDLRPEEELFTQLLCQFYLKEGQMQSAIQLYEDILMARPDDMNAAMALADLYRETGQTASADSLMRAMSQLDGASADQLVERARALYRRSRSDVASARQAARFLEQALEQAPDHEEALHLLGDLRYQSEQYEEAAALLHRALDQNPRALDRWIQASAAYLQADQAREAVEVAEEGLLLFPGQAPLVEIHARGLFRLNRNRAAIEQFESLRALLKETGDAASRLADVQAMLGLLYNRVGNMDASDAAYAVAISLDDDHDLALNNYAYSLASRGLRLDEALDMAQRAVDIDTSNASYLDTLGWVYYQLEDYESAATWLQRAIDTGEASATVYEHYGDVQRALDNVEAARSYWQQALDRAPNREALRQKLDALSN